AEMKFGAEIAKDPDVRQKRLSALRRLQHKPLLMIDAATGITFGELVAALTLQGKGHRQRVQDLWLASQAVQHGFTFLTRNGKDFADIPGLVLVVL
ncbi:MAG: VapC toxin family PIN domain ribonuclease, partial [Desulfuromonadales bacterium]